MSVVFCVFLNNSTTPLDLSHVKCETCQETPGLRIRVEIHRIRIRPIEKELDLTDEKKLDPIVTSNFFCITDINLVF